MKMNPVVVDVTVPPKLKLLSFLGELIELLIKKVADNCENDSDLAFNMNLALTEASANAMMHGCMNNPSDNIRVKMELYDDCLKIEIIDSGKNFDLKKLEVSGQPDPLNDTGRGLYIINQLMDNVEQHSLEDGSKFVMYKKITPIAKAS